MRRAENGMSDLSVRLDRGGVRRVEWSIGDGRRAKVDGRKSMGETIDRPSPFDPRLWTIDHIEGERLASTVGQREAFGARLEASEHFRVALGAGLERVHGDRQVFRRWQALHVKCTVLVW